MIGSSILKMLGDGYDNPYVIEADNVAHVMDSNTALHAALVLVRVGYNSIPVLDKDNHFLGTISLANIMNTLFDSDENIDHTYLSKLTVKQIMDTTIKPIVEPLSIETMLHKLVDYNYLPVVDKDNYFKGILTRKEMLKAINYVAHELELEYDVVAKTTSQFAED